MHTLSCYFLLSSKKKMKNISILLLNITILISFSLANAQQQPTEKLAKLNEKWPACHRAETLLRMGSIARSGDQEAWAKYTARAINEGECIFYQKGQVVFIEEGGYQDGVPMFKVRKKGDPDSYWVFATALD